MQSLDEWLAQGIHTLGILLHSSVRITSIHLILFYLGAQCLSDRARGGRYRFFVLTRGVVVGGRDGFRAPGCCRYKGGGVCSFCVAFFLPVRCGGYGKCVFACTHLLN